MDKTLSGGYRFGNRFQLPGFTWNIAHMGSCCNRFISRILPVHLQDCLSNRFNTYYYRHTKLSDLLKYGTKISHKLSER